MIDFREISGRTPRGLLVCKHLRPIEGEDVKGRCKDCHEPITPLLHVAWSTLWLWEKRGEFPKRMPLVKGPRKNPRAGRVGWRRSEVQEWLESRKTA